MSRKKPAPEPAFRRAASWLKNGDSEPPPKNYLMSGTPELVRTCRSLQDSLFDTGWYVQSKGPDAASDRDTQPE